MTTSHVQPMLTRITFITALAVAAAAAPPTLAAQSPVGSELRRFIGHNDDVVSVAFSPDGRTALSGSDDNTLILWDVASGSELRRFTGHRDDVWSVAFSPDGRTALSGSGDETLILWQVQ